MPFRFVIAWITSAHPWLGSGCICSSRQPSFNPRLHGMPPHCIPFEPPLNHLRPSAVQEKPNRGHVYLIAQFLKIKKKQVKWILSILFSPAYPGLSWWLRWYRICLLCRRPRFNPRGWEDSPGEGNGNTPQYSCLGNSTDRGGWKVIVHRVAKSLTWLSD